jgi:hypothetical protein
MGLILHPITRKRKSIDLCEAFANNAPANATGHVFYGVDASNLAIWRRVLRTGVPFYYIDNSYFDVVRGQQFRVTKNRVQKFVGDEISDGLRFGALGLTLKPMRGPAADGVDLYVEQSEAFMDDVARDPTWLSAIFLRRSLFSRSELRRWDPHKFDLRTSFQADLARANRVITHSSAAAVEALMAGVEVLVSPMSAVDRCPLGGRLRYMWVLADNQWTLDEMKEGVAWKWLNREQSEVGSLSPAGLETAT